jgi:Enoyl-(Acyl carrier protein) reductase
VRAGSERRRLVLGCCRGCPASEEPERPLRLGARVRGVGHDGQAAVGGELQALVYAPRGIRINAVCPGTIETPMVTDMIARGELDIAEAEANQPIGRLGRGEEIAAAVLWLCSPGASFVLGVALPVDGGYTAH